MPSKLLLVLILVAGALQLAATRRLAQEDAAVLAATAIEPTNWGLSRPGYRKGRPGGYKPPSGGGSNGGGDNGGGGGSIPNYAQGNNAIFTGPETPDLCDVGPTWWCQSQQTMNVCMVNDLTVGVCGYSSSAGGCPKSTLKDFCATNPTAKTFNGGLSGSPTGYFGYFALAMYWAPSSCNSTSSSGGFCSPYTSATSYSATHLVLHGLWPDYGSLYNPPVPSNPPFYNGSYQGWPQWCDGDGIKTSQCSVPGEACPWANATSLSQSQLETCLRVEGVKECIVSDDITNSLGSKFADIAPGYLAAGGKPSTFMDHEYFKHGSCIGGYLSHNITAYYDISVQLAKMLTAPGTAADKYIHANSGGKVNLKELERGLKGQGVPTCKRNSCVIEEIWYCLDRTAAGFPTGLIVCPIGTLASNSCAKNGCTDVIIPAWS